MTSMGNPVRLDQAYLGRPETAPAPVEERNAFWLKMIGVQITLWTTLSVLAGLYWGFQIYQVRAYLAEQSAAVETARALVLSGKISQAMKLTKSCNELKVSDIKAWVAAPSCKP
jgi:hypothetical protein